MAARVNTKFVVGLIAAIVLLLAGAVFVAKKAIQRSGDDLVAEGDKFAAQGDFEKAASAYGRAVNKDQRNAEWIVKWIAALEETAPATQQAYQDRYFKEYRGGLRALVESDRSNLANFRRFLDEQLLFTHLQGQRLDAWEQMSRAADDLLKIWRGDEAGKNTLRRYRGLAQVGIHRVNPEVREEDLRPGYEDLLAALSSNPKDEQAAIGAAVMEAKLAEAARKRADEAEAKKQFQAAKDRLTKFVADNPPAPFAAYQLLTFDIVERTRLSQTATSTTSPSAAAAAEAEASTRGAELARVAEKGIVPIIQAIKSTPPEALDPIAVIDVAFLATQFVPKGMGNFTTGVAVGLDLLEHVRAGHPKHAGLLLHTSGMLARSRGEVEAAEQLFKKVDEVALPKLCLQGALLRDQQASATAERIGLAFSQWETLPETAKKEAALASALDLRKRLTTFVAESSNPVLAADARIEMMKGNFMGARSLATRYNDQTNRSDVDMLALEAEILKKMGNSGAAKEIYRRILQRQPASLPALLRLSEIELAEGNYVEAGRYMRQAAVLRPDIPELKERAGLITELQSQQNRPEVRALQEAQLKAQGIAKDLPGAIEILRKALEQSPGDVMLTRALVILLVQTNDREAARAALQSAIAAHPEDQSLQRLQTAIENDDPAAAALLEIDKMPIQDYQKELARYEVYQRVGKADTAIEHLRKALELRPEDPVVVEMMFQDQANRSATAQAQQQVAEAKGDQEAAAKAKALREITMAEVKRLASLAETRNLDQVNGLLFRARVEVLNGRMEEAIRLLKEAVAKDKYSLLGWRLLGMLLLDTKQYAPAVDALAKAVEISPTDSQSAKSYVRVLYITNRVADALAFARRVEPALGGDAEFAELLLQLEAIAPTGDLARAIQIRDNLRRLNPDNKLNKYLLAALYIDDRQYEKARNLVAEFRQADPMDANAVKLDATLRGEQGDREGAMRVYQEYLNALPADKRNDRVYIEAARTIEELGWIEAAETILTMGRKYQDAQKRTIDRHLGDMLFRANRMEPAIAAYRRAAEVGTPEEIAAVRRRIIEALLRNEQYAEADKEIKEMGAAGQRDPVLLLLAAESAVLQNDRERARRLYDQVISVDPKGAMGFLKRGDFNRADLSMAREVEQDYLQVIQLDPAFNPARARLAALYAETGRADQAIDQFRQAIQASPMDEQLRTAYIDLLVQRGRAAEAVVAVEEIVKLRPTDTQWLFKGGLLALRAGSPDKASEYFGVLWKMRPSPDAAVLYIGALLSKNPPDRNTANQVLQSPDLNVDQSIPLLLAQARYHRLSQEMSKASAGVLKAYGLVNASKREEVSAFVGGLEGVYPKPEELLAALSRLEERAPFTEWMAFHSNLVRMRDKAMRSQVRVAMDQLAASATDPKLRGAAYGVIGAVETSEENWPAAVDAFRKGAEADPENAELQNNYAYLAATKLDKAREVLEFAERAVKIAPNVSNFVDTLASVHLKLKNYDKAAEILAQALTVATNDNERAPVLLHMAQARMGQGNRAEARRLYQLVEKVFDGIPATKEQYQSDLKELRKLIDAP